MKQYILFENGKLYVVELPEKPTTCHNKCSKLQECSCDWLTVVYGNRREAALANKVEVKNHELISNICKSLHADVWFNDKGIKIKECETFPLPADLTFDKETGMLKRIEPEKSIARRIYDETPQEVKDKVRAYGNEVVKKSVEPEKMNAEQILKKHLEHVSFITPNETFLKVIDAMQEYRDMIEPEKPEETQEELWRAFDVLMNNSRSSFILANRHFTIQLKKS
jgi:hypothetical protein